MKEVAKKMKKSAGFTLAELLIVVAIIAVLVAIAIPIFTTQLEKSKDSTSVANLRSAYAQAQTAAVAQSAEGMDDVEYDIESDGSGTIKVKNVLIETTRANSWSGQGGDLPWNVGSATIQPADGGKQGTATVTFTYEGDKITEVSYAVD